MLDDRFIMTESTKKVVDSILTEDLKNLSEQEIINKLNESKKVIVRLTESGKIEVKQVLLG